MSSTSSQRSHYLKRVFPPNPRPRPRPFLFSASTAALASRSRSTTETSPCRAARSSGVSPREPRPEAKPAGRTQRNQGRKTLRKFWHLKRRSFGNCGHSKSSLDLRGIVGLRCLEAIELVEIAMGTTLADWVWIHVESAS